MAFVPAFTSNGITRPELTLDGSGNIVLDPPAAAAAAAYGTKFLYMGLPPTPYPPVAATLSTPVDSNAAANSVVEGAAANTLVNLTVSASNNAGTPITYSLIGDTSGGGFTINATTGVVTVADPSKINFETAAGHAYSVTAQASDGTLVRSQTFTIGVSDVAPSTPTDSNAAVNTVVEGAATGTAVGITASATDINGPAVTYSLVGDTSGGGFTINAATGVITVADASKVDYESAAGHAYSVTAQASDGTLSNSQTFTIGVSNAAPSTPTDSNAATNSVTEGAANGSTVGITASSTDPGGPAVTWSLIGDTSGGGFTINAVTGVVTVADATKIDYETAAGHAYSVTAQASDGTLTNSHTFTIAVSDAAPSAPVDSNAVANTVTEGAANGSTVGVTASSTDVNGPAVTYSLTGDSSGGGFTINAATGVVTVADATKINYETAAGHAYTVTAQASDGTLSNSQTFTIAVSDVLPSTPVDSDAATNTIAEGAANGSTVGITASSTDVNGPAVTYALTGDTSGGAFTINSATGVITVADASKIDYESAAGHAYTVTAQASDGTLSNSQTFTIAVSDVAPSTPIDSNAGTNTIAEGPANGSTVGVTASSTDVNGPPVTYALTGDTSGGGFTINSATGVVTVADSTKIDFESAPGHAYTVTAQASGGALSNSQTFTIAVTDVVPSAPVDSDAAANTVAEGAANGSTVGITASSADLNGPAVTYSLTSDSSLGAFTINAATGVITVADATKIDYESAPGHSYTVAAQASDGTLSNSQTFTIAVSDVAPSAPVDSDAAANSILEGAANGSTVGVTASSTDVNGPAVTWSLVGDTSGGAFTINSTTGVVTVADTTKIDYETAPGHAYTVTAQASGGALSNSQTFTIAVGNVAPSTPIDSDTADNAIVEGAANGSTVGVTASSTDVNGPPVIWSLTSDSSGGGLTINAATGVITVADATKIDYESAPGHAYTVTAQASDGALSNSQTFTIAVSDVAPSTPVDSDAAANSVVQGAAVGTYSGVTASSTDVNGPAVIYTLVGDTSGGGFTINSATGAVTVADSSKIIYTAGTPSYDVTVDSSDTTQHSQHVFTIGVSPNAAPVIDSDGSGATAAKSVVENTTAVTTVHATDPDSGPSPVSYSIVGGDDAAQFSIVASGAGAGTLTFLTEPDFENPTDTGTAGSNTYIVTVRASDGAAFDDQTITVTVTNANDAPVITSNLGGPTASINVDENSTAVTTVTATDQDFPAQTLTYSLVGGSDQGKFTIDPSTGVLSFISAPNFEAPTDSNTDNQYDVIVRVTDSGAPNLQDDQAIAVHVQNVNEAPSTNAITTSGAEDAPSIAITVTGTDVDAGDSVTSFHITGVPGGAQGVLYSDVGLTTAVNSGDDVGASGNAHTFYFVPTANFNGPVTFNAAATDSHVLTDATPAVETINVTAVDDAPVNNGVPGPFTVMSGFTHAITGLSISDIDANEGGTATDITTTLTSAGGGSVNIGAVGGGATITGNGTGTVTLTGSIAEINTSLGGSVVYTAADGATGSSTTTLTIATNDHGHTGSGGPITDTDVISVGVTPQVWFINQDQTTLDGTAPRGSQTNPFTDVHEFNTSSGPGNNDYIYVKAGTYTGEGIDLKPGQTLLGDDQALSLPDPFGGPAIVIEPASGARPTIHVTSGQGIDLSTNNTVAGINIQTDAGTTGLDDGQGAGGNAVGSLNVSHMAISGAGQAVDIDQGGALNVTLDSVSSTGGAEGIQLAGTASSGAGLLSGTFSGGTGAISGATVAGVLVGDGAGTASTGGTAVISYAGTISAGAGVNTVNIQDHTTGAVTLSGNLTHTGGSGSAVVLDDNSSNFTFSGSTSNLTSGTSNAINITDQSGGTVAFSGALNIDTTSGTGVNLGGTDTGATFNFTGGGLTIDTTGGTGLSATGGGTINVTGTGNHISSGAGTALNISNTTIGASNVTFHDINASGGTNGIVLNTTGSSGGLTVTGTGTTAGSGGTIQNTVQGGVFTSTSNLSLSNMNFTNADSGNGTVNNVDSAAFNSAAQAALNLSSVSTATFTNLSVTGGGGAGGAQVGINGQNVSNLTIANSTVSNFGDNVGEGDVKLFNLSGTSAVTNSTFSFLPGDPTGGENLFEIRNNTGTLTLNVTGSTFQNTRDSGTGSGGIALTSTGTATINANISNSNFLNLKTSGVEAFAKQTSTMNINITDGGTAGNGNIFDPTGTNQLSRAIGLNAQDTAHLNFNINRNEKIYGSGGPIINIYGQDSANLQGRIDNNGDIQNNNTSATSIGGPIFIHTTSTAATAVIEVIGNTILNNGGSPSIEADVVGQGGASDHGTMDLTIKNNTLAFGGKNLTASNIFNDGIYLTSGASNTDATVMTADVQNNSVTGITVPSGNVAFVVGNFGGPSAHVYLQAFATNTATTWASLGNTPGTSVLDNGGAIGAVPAGHNGGNTITPSNPAALLAAAGGVQAASPTLGEMHLTQSELDTVVAVAIAQWAAAGASATQLAAMHATTFDVADLVDNVVGEQTPGHITIDTDADGHAWFIDPTPNDNAEFTHAANAAGTDLFTDPTTAAAGHLDLLTTVTHELGHVIGLPDSTAPGDVNDLMYINLVDGERRLPAAADVAQANATGPAQVTALNAVHAAESALPVSAQAPAAAPIVVGTAANDTIDAGHGGNIVFGGGGADNFVFHAAAALTHVADYNAAQGDTLDLLALTGQLHASSVSDALVVHAVEDASGTFATLRVSTDALGFNPGPTWVDVARIDGAHAGDAMNVLIDSQGAAHLAHLHFDLV